VQIVDVDFLVLLPFILCSPCICVKIFNIFTYSLKVLVTEVSFGQPQFRIGVDAAAF